MKKELRKYQQEAVDAIFSRLNAGVSKQICVMATGLGKTISASEVVKKFNKTLWITHSEELISQSASVLQTILQPDENALIPTVGIIKAELFQTERPIVVASIQTLWRRLDKIPSDLFDCIIVDETHLAMANTWTKAIEHFDPKLLLGLTATPDRLDGVSLLNLYQEIVFERDIKFGIENKYLCELDCIRVKTDISIDDVRTTAGELNAKDLRKLDTPDRNALVVSKYKEHATGRQALAFCVDVQHAINLCAEFNRQGVSCEFVVGDEQLCPDRKDRIQRFTTGKTEVLCNVMVLTAGFDYPECSCIIMARPTKSRTLFLQAIGRGTRLKLGKFKDTLILDIVDSTTRHNLINCAELDKDNDVDNKVFWNTEHKERVRALIAEKRKRESKIDHNLAKDVRVNLFKLPKVKISRYSTYDEPATQKQLDWISAKGYDVELNTYTKGQCSEIIAKLPASRANIAYLKENGYDISNPEITVGQYQAAKNEIEKRIAKAKKKPTTYLEDEKF